MFQNNSLDDDHITLSIMNADRMLDDGKENQIYVSSSSNLLDGYEQDNQLPKEIPKEENQFEKYYPLRTLFHFSVGPLMFNCGISFHDAIDLVLISKALSTSTLQVVGFSSLVRYLCMCGAIFFSQATITKISGLLGEKRYRDAEQVVADIYRLSMIGIGLFMLVFFFISKPLLKFMGCTDDITEQGYQYFIPILLFMPLITLFQVSCGFLQSEGRSVLCGIMQLTAFALNCCVFAPILLFVVKVPLKLAGISFALSQAIPGIVLTILIFSGKFTLKPQWKQLFRGFKKDSFHALLLASPFFINVLAGTLPPMLLLTLIMKAAKEAGISEQVGEVFPVFIKTNSAVNSVSIGICQGFLGAGSYCSGAEQWSRLLKLFCLCGLVTFLYHLCLMPLLAFHADIPARLWIIDPDNLKLARKMLAIPFYTNTLIPLNFAFVNMLLIMRKAISALALTIIRGGLYVGYTFLFYKLDKQSPIQLMHAYNCDDATLFVLGMALVIPQVMYIVKRMKTSNPYQSFESVQ